MSDDLGICRHVTCLVSSEYILVLIAIVDKPSGKREKWTRVAASVTRSSNCLTSFKRAVIALPLFGTCQQAVTKLQEYTHRESPIYPRCSARRLAKVRLGHVGTMENDRAVGAARGHTSNNGNDGAVCVMAGRSVLMRVVMSGGRTE